MPQAASNPPPTHDRHDAEAAHGPRAAPWLELTLEVPAELGEDVGALLVDLGAMGAELLAPRPFARRDWHAHASMGPEAERGRTEVPTGASPAVVYVVASFAERAAPAGSGAPDWTAAELLAAARAALLGVASAEALGSMRCRRRDDGAWAQSWREHFKPLKIGRRMWIVPSWDHHFQPPTGSCVLTIDPGMAFGTGQHATTALCLKAIERLADRRSAARPPRPWRVLDVGTGTGILALAALQLGAQEAEGIDTDPEARTALTNNAAQMQLERRLRVADSLVAPAASDRPYDLVVANILANVLIEMMDHLVAHTAQDGLLVLSGILTEQAHSVAVACERAAKKQKRPLAKVAELQHDGWVALAFGSFG